MTIVPALDLRGGKCVRLLHGDRDLETQYDVDPVERARKFVAAGAERLHVVDLDGAFGEGANLEAIRAICRGVNVPVQTGGGLRTADDVEAHFEAGASSIVLGTLLVEDPDLVKALLATYGNRLLAGIDAWGEAVAIRGWRSRSAVDRDTLVNDVAVWGFERIVFTEIGRDGAGEGYDVEALAHVAALTPLKVTASGGARTIDDLLTLRDATPANVDHAIVGRALYEGTIELSDAIAALKA